MRFNKNFFVFFLATIVFCLPFVTRADGPKISSFSLAGQTGNVTFNPTTGDDSPLVFSITADRPVKFTTISICVESDSVCNRTSAFKFFTNNNFSATVEKPWYGKNSKDEVAANGNYKIKVTMKDEKDVSSEEFLPVLITVDSSATALGGGGSEEEDNNENSDASSGGDSSAHSSQAGLSDYEEEALKIGAGRPRLASIRTPIEFRAESNGVLAGVCQWSFGDGASQIGQVVRHSYQFPGVYNVVLNFASSEDGSEGVARTTVMVTEANFSMRTSPSEGYLEIKNLGSQEENINDWTIRNGTTTIFTFAKDTIISGRSNIKVALPKEVLNFNLSLDYPDGEVQTRINNLASVAQIVELKAKLSEARKVLAEIKGEEKPAVWAALPTAQTAGGPNPKVFQPSASSTSRSTLASGSDIIIIEKKDGILTKFLKVIKNIY